MAGHSKWANIRHRKGAQDIRRGKIFTKLIREITSAARVSPDPSSNPRLRLVMDKALDENMSRDTIDRAIKRGVGDASQDHLEEIRYEGYGPNGVAVMVDCLSDNRNRTASEVRHAFTKHGGNLGSDGSVAYLFKKLGRFSVPRTVEESKLMDLALAHDALDVIENAESWDILTAPEHYTVFKAALSQAGIACQESTLSFIPTTMAAVEDKEAAEALLKLIDMLEDLDDVQEVYTNAEIAEAVLEQLS